MLELVRLALRISTDRFDTELNMHIEAALADLGVAGVTTREETDPLIQQAVCTYCKIHMGLISDAAEAKRLAESYDEQKAQLSMHTGHTDWTVSRNV